MVRRNIIWNIPQIVLCCQKEHYSWVIPQSTVLLQKLTVLHLVGTVLAFYRTWRLISTLTKPCHLPNLRQLNTVNALPSCFLAAHLILSTHLFIAVPSVSFRFPHQNPVCISVLCYMCHMTAYLTHSHFITPVDIQWTLQVTNKANIAMFHIVLLRVACNINVSSFCNGVAHCVCMLLTQNCDLLMCFVSVMALHVYVCNRCGLYRLKKQLICASEICWLRLIGVHWYSPSVCTVSNCPFRRLLLCCLLSASNQGWPIDIGKLDLFLGHQVDWVTDLTHNFILKE